MTLKEIERHRAAIVEFHNAYVAYVEGGPEGDPDVRSRVVGLAAREQAAMAAAGVHPTLYPPPAFGGPIRHGLTNIMFEHEQRRIGGNEIVRNVLDWCRITDGELEKCAEMMRRRRKNPLYWGDLALRTVLGIPAYLLSLIFRTSFDRIDESAFGVVLRLVSAAGSIAAIYAVGREAGWW